MLRKYSSIDALKMLKLPLASTRDERYYIHSHQERVLVQDYWSLGSAGEHRLHTAGVTGSNPVATTTNDKAGIKWFRPFSFKCVEVDSL